MECHASAGTHSTGVAGVQTASNFAVTGGVRGAAPRTVSQADCAGAFSLPPRCIIASASARMAGSQPSATCFSTVCVTQHDNNNNSVCERNRGATFYLLSSVHEFDAGRKGLVKGARRPM